jgi:hypothetical protein
MGSAAQTRAGLEVGALGAQSTSSGLKIRFSSFNPRLWAAQEIANAPVSF